MALSRCSKLALIFCSVPDDPRLSSVNGEATNYGQKSRQKRLNRGRSSGAPWQYVAKDPRA